MCVVIAKVTAGATSAAVTAAATSAATSAAITTAATLVAAATSRCNGLSLKPTTASGGRKIKVGCARLARGYVDLVTVTSHMKSA